MNTLASLSALALAAAACGAAQAQTSSVTLYGRIDLNLTHFNGEGWAMQQASNSRFGLRGSEDLGGGMNAVFQVESRINAQNGTVESPRFWGREAWVGLRAGWGTLRLGRSLSPSQRVASNYDPHGTDGIGSFGSSGLLLGHSSNNFVRFDSGVYYETPQFSGFSVFAALAMDDTPAPTDERFHSIRLRYAAGPLDASLAVGKLSAGNDVTSFGLSYKLGDFKPMLQWHGGERGGNKRGSWLVGALVVMGQGEWRIAHSKQDDKRAVNPIDRTLTAVGYGYALSRRTELYGTLARDKTDNQSARNGLEAGIKHAF